MSFIIRSRDQFCWNELLVPRFDCPIYTIAGYLAAKLESTPSWRGDSNFHLFVRALPIMLKGIVKLSFIRFR